MPYTVMAAIYGPRAAAGSPEISFLDAAGKTFARHTTTFVYNLSDRGGAVTGESLRRTSQAGVRPLLPGTSPGDVLN